MTSGTSRRYGERPKVSREPRVLSCPIHYVSSRTTCVNVKRKENENLSQEKCDPTSIVCTGGPKPTTFGTLSEDIDVLGLERRVDNPPPAVGPESGGKRRHSSQEASLGFIGHARVYQTHRGFESELNFTRLTSLSRGIYHFIGDRNTRDTWV